MLSDSADRRSPPKRTARKVAPDGRAAASEARLMR